MLNNMPIIKGKVGDKEAYFLLDTGAKLGLIDSKQKDEFKLSDGRIFMGVIVGAGGDTTKYSYYCDTKITIGEKEINNFVFMDMTNIVNSILRDSGIKILGVISYPQIKELGIIIDPVNNEAHGI